MLTCLTQTATRQRNSLHILHGGCRERWEARRPDSTKTGARAQQRRIRFRREKSSGGGEVVLSTILRAPEAELTKTGVSPTKAAVTGALNDVPSEKRREGAMTEGA